MSELVPSQDCLKELEKALTDRTIDHIVVTLEKSGFSVPHYIKNHQNGRKTKAIISWCFSRFQLWKCLTSVLLQFEGKSAMKSLTAELGNINGIFLFYFVLEYITPNRNIKDNLLSSCPNNYLPSYGSTQCVQVTPNPIWSIPLLFRNTD